MTSNTEGNVKKMKFSEEISNEQKNLIISEEVCKPLSNIEDVLKYKNIFCNSKPHIFKHDNYVIPNSSSVCHQDSQELLIDQRIDSFTVPKTLVCHDMKGGYLEDRFRNGCDVGNGYTFYRWSNIDIFIYFSHHLVTIPPIGWIKLAHQSNVKILGTFITEWKDGEKQCNEIFESENNWVQFANALVNISLFYSFDGWLLNIENKIKDTIPLVRFIGYLTKEMHRVHPDSIVLWYDSVIETGELKWQNELNDLNKCYFDACDGIFVNYTWKEENLKNSVLKAEHRLLDVFIGVDVFGRNCFGGGGFNTHSALEIVRKHNLSVALFAQGWTHETIKTEEKDNFFELFCRNDNAFWLNVYPYLYTHPITDCFVTTFYLGSDKESYNLSNQELVISRPAHCGKDNELNSKIIHECECVQLHMNGSKLNTISYLITNPGLEKDKEYFHDVFKCNIDCKKNIVISYISKSYEKEENDFYIFILARNIYGKYFKFKLVHEKAIDVDKYSVRPLSENSPYMQIIGENIKFGKISDGWEIRYYYIMIESPFKILNIGAVLKGGPILLGGFALQADLKL